MMTMLFLLSLCLFLGMAAHGVFLGTDKNTGKKIHIPVPAFDTHVHLIGATGKGKTVAIKTLLHSLLADPMHKHCFILVDRMGGFSWDLLRWFATQAPQHARRRLVYIEAANEDHIVGFNPLIYTTPAQGYYKVARATEIILRAWESVDIQAMPRLARWSFNAFYAAAQLNLNIADCVHFLLPFSDLHSRLLSCLPEQLRFEWQEIMQARGRAGEILESTRNRLKPYWEMPILQQMFSVSRNRLDVLRWMQEGKIVLLNLAPQGRIPEQIADALGGLVLNEVLSVLRSQPMGVRYHTHLVLDEFQRFVGPDIEAAIPEIRQLGGKLWLSHQSFAQLKRGNYDLTSLIWQPQTRLAFGVQGEDADLLAHEFASLTFNPNQIKDEIWHRKQLVTDHTIIELASQSNAESFARQWSETFGINRTTHENVHEGQVTGEGSSRADQEGRGQGGSSGNSRSFGTHQALLPVYEKFMELSSRTYVTFDESRNVWASTMRKLKKGEALLRLVDDPTLYHIAVHKSAPGSLDIDWQTVQKKMPRVAESLYKLLEANFQQDCFVSPALVRQETQQRLEQVLQQSIIVGNSQREVVVAEPEVDGNNMLD